MQRRFALLVVLSCLLGAGGPALGYGESPKETMIAWYETLMENYELPQGRLMDAMIGFYSVELQDQFMPEIYRDSTAQERTRAEKATAKAAEHHRDWGAFLATNDFEKVNFEHAEEHVEEGVATVVVRSNSNTVRSFRLCKESGRDWVISELPPPNQYAAMVRVLVIVIAATVALGLIARKMIFS